MLLDPPCGAGAGLEVVFLEALEDLMGEPRPCWVYASSFQSPGLALAAAAAGIAWSPVRHPGLGGGGERTGTSDQEDWAW